MLTATVAIALAIAAAPAEGQSAPPSGQKFTIASSQLRGYHNLQRNLLEAAEKMPDADYTFKPTPQTRPFGQLVAHVALSQFASCAALKGEPNPKKDEKEDAPRSKADQVVLLKASTAYCDPLLDALTDESITQTFKTGPNGANEAAKGLVLIGTNIHGNEMYGTMAVYLRLKGLVPPTTERENAAKK